MRERGERREKMGTKTGAVNETALNEKLGYKIFIT